MERLSRYIKNMVTARRSAKMPLVVIMGETASGKSALALELAERVGGELICADSWTVYRSFDIGTAKPTAEDRARVPHHLLDIAEPSEGFSVVEFQRQALAAMDAIAARGRIPIIVGGTGLYIDSVVFGYEFLPPPPPGIRETLSRLSLQELQVMVARAGLDTTDIDMYNKRRVIRLIENHGARPGRHELRANTLIFGLKTDREQLRERIVRRVDHMLAAGLEQEVRTLSGHYGWDIEPMKGIGYREFYEYFHGLQSLDQTRERIISGTLNLAKRQRTWFKRNNSIQWLPTEHKLTEAVDITTTFLNK